MDKLCKSCSARLETGKFSKCAKEKDGLQSKCKSCYKIYQAKRYLANKEKINAANKSWYESNKQQVIARTVAYKKERRQADPLFKATVNLRRRLNRALKASRWHKNCDFNSYIGCTLSDLHTHMEVQFTVGMTWGNYGQWHIDHIIPLSSAQSESELFKLCHYTNLQPLWALDNIKKGSNHVRN